MTAKARKMMHHEPGGAFAPEKHAPEIGHTKIPAKAGHGHSPGTKPHKD